MYNNDLVKYVINTLIGNKSTPSAIQNLFYVLRRTKIMKKKLLVTIVGMTLAFAMLTGCGSDGKDTTTTTNSEAVQTTDEATDNTTVSDTDTESESESEDENTSDTTEVSDTPEVSDAPEDFSAYWGAFGYGKGTKDADGNNLVDATNRLTWSIYNFYGSDGGAPFNWHEVVEYVDVDGEQWGQATYTFDADARDYEGYTVNYVENPFVIAVSPDKTKVLYKDVVYTVPEE